ncbi:MULTISPECIES: FMN-dependent NADH-azoreductase [Aquimarina]|uniref:FMN-dependent NADH-azoreductase n=1 Tax=Aquimarina TaxID=290174 RepID=UPI000943634A|nr:MULTISPECIES: NAD(P)H-dependent oxidoreductase [Aquimarina]
MKTLLRIDASSRTQGSHSRELADYLETKWRTLYPSGKVIYRDLVTSVIPHIHNTTIQGFYTPKERMSQEFFAATALSDELIKELNGVDEILISSPLYNLNIPSNLKAYIDHVVRIDHTFGIHKDGSYHGLLKDKKAYLALVKGGTYVGTAMQAYDFQEPYLKAILHHMGIMVKNIFSLEGTSKADILQHNITNIHKQIDTIFKN